MIRSMRGRFVVSLFSFAGATLVAGCDTPTEPAAPAQNPGSISPPAGNPGVTRQGPTLIQFEAIKKDGAEPKKDADATARDLNKEAGDKASGLKKEAGDAAKKIEEKGSELKKEAGDSIKKGEEALGKGLENLEKKLEPRPK